MRSRLCSGRKRCIVEKSGAVAEDGYWLVYGVNNVFVLQRADGDAIATDDLSFVTGRKNNGEFAKTFTCQDNFGRCAWIRR